MGVFDQAARYAAQEDPQPILRRLAGDARESLRFREWVESRTTPLPGERDRTADRIAAMHDEANLEQPWLLLLEFQAEHDPDKLDITLVEVARLRTEVRHGPDRKGKYKILAGLVYLRGRCPESELDMTVSDDRGTWHRPGGWNVEEDDAGQALEEVAAVPSSWGVLFWIPLMRGGGEPGNIGRWKELAGTLPDARRRSDLGRIALVFAELAGCYLAWEKALEDFAMTESQVVNRWIEKARADEKLETTWGLLLRVLRKRFPEATLTDVVQTVHSQPSLILLEDWFDAANTVASFGDFLAILRR